MALAEDTIGSMQDLDIVVDTDHHLTDAEPEILPYLESPWKQLVEPVVTGETLSSGVYPRPGILHPASGRIDSQSNTTPDEVQEAMDMLGLDYAVLTPGLAGFVAAIHHDELAAAIAQAYNDWLVDTFLDAGYHGAVLVAPQRAARAAEEIDDRADEPGVVGAFVPTSGTYPPLGHEVYHPVYEACERAGLPILLHGTASLTWSNFPLQHKGLTRHFSLHVVTHAFEHMTHLTSMITRGIPVRFPDLDIVVQEAGLGWIPYFMHRLDHEYPSHREDLPLLDRPPSEYLREQFYFTSQPVEGVTDHEYVQNAVRAFDGEDSLMFASDYPHHDFDNSNELFNCLRGGFDAAELSAIYGETAMEVFGF